MELRLSCTNPLMYTMVYDVEGILLLYFWSYLDTLLYRKYVDSHFDPI